MKKLLAILVVCFSVFLTAPPSGFAHPRGDVRHGGYPGGGYYDGHRSYYGSYYPNHRNHHHDDVFWGVTGFLFGTALGAAVYQPPVYYSNPPVYYYQPPMCRYERYETDPWGRTFLRSFVAPCR